MDKFRRKMFCKMEGENFLFHYFNSTLASFHPLNPHISLNFIDIIQLTISKTDRQNVRIFAK